MKIHSTARKAIDLFIKEKHLDKKRFYGMVNQRYEIIVRTMEKNFDCGGSENIMAEPNISIMAGLFALWDASHRRITVDEMVRLIDETTPQRIPVITDLCRNNFSAAAKLINNFLSPMVEKVTEHKARGEWKDAWGIEIKSADKESLSFDLIGCPLVEFAQKYGYERIMPALCKSDYITIRQLGLKLIRPQIVSEGYERCTFTYVPDKD